MNTFDQAGTAPRVGLIELPDLADLLARSGVNVVTGATFREAATSAKEASAAASKPLPLVIGDRPTAEDGRQAPGINAWAKKMSAQHRVVIVRNHTENILTVEKAAEITLPTTLNTIFGALGLPPLASDVRYPGSAAGTSSAPDAPEPAAANTYQAPAAENLNAAPAVPAPTVSEFFTAPEAPAPSFQPPVADEFYTAPAPAAPVPSFQTPAASDFYAAPAPAPAAGEFQAVPAPADPAENDFYSAPAAPVPSFQTPSASDFYAAPAPAPAAGEFQTAPAPAAPVPSFQTPSASDFYAAPAPAPAAGEFQTAPAPADPAENDFYSAPAAPVPSFQTPSASDFYAAPAPAPVAPAASEFQAAPAPAAPVPSFQTPAASDFYAAPAPVPVAPAAPVSNEFHAASATPVPPFQSPAASEFQAAPAPAAPVPSFQTPAASDFYAAPVPAPVAPAASEFQAAPAAPVPSFQTPAASDFYAAPAPAPVAPAASEFQAAPAAPVPSFQAPAASDFYAAPAPAPAVPAANDFQAAPAPAAPVPSFQTPAASDFYAAPAPAANDFYGAPAPAADFYGAPPSSPGTAGPVSGGSDALYGAPPSSPGYGAAPAQPLPHHTLQDVNESIDRHQSARRRSAGHSTTHLANVIICIAGKGGVGKTTTAVSLAQIAAEAGLKVILIDGNVGQADLRTYLRTANSDLPTIYDAAIGRESAIVGPGALNGVRRPEQGKVGFGFVAGPPHDSSVDQYVVTNRDYEKVILEARQKVDLVILDTQILEARDDSGFVSDVVQPLLLESAFALGIADMTSPGVERLNERLLSLINHGTPKDRIMIMINDVPLDQMGVADNGQRYFQQLGTFVGAVPTNVEEIHDVMNAGSVPSDNRELRLVLTDVLARSTGADVFNEVPEEPAAAPAAKSGLLSRMFKSKKAA